MAAQRLDWHTKNEGILDKFTKYNQESTRKIEESQVTIKNYEIELGKFKEQMKFMVKERFEDIS